MGSPYFQEVAIIENTVSLSWMPPGGDKIVTGYKLYIADELGKVFKTTVIFIRLATHTEFLARLIFADIRIAFWRQHDHILKF